MSVSLPFVFLAFNDTDTSTITSTSSRKFCSSSRGTSVSPRKCIGMDIVE